MNIFPAATEETIAAVRVLWREYWDSLQLPPDFQNFNAELAGLPGVYGSPGGIILLAQLDQVFAGTVALRALGVHAGEMKRMYIRPQFRGCGVGRALLDRIICAAREFGYSALYADTLRSMESAQRLYASYGFQETAAYSADPTPSALYLRLDLKR